MQHQQQFQQPETQNPKQATQIIKPALVPEFRTLYLTEVAKRFGWNLYQCKKLIKDAGIELSFRKWHQNTTTGKKELKTFYRRKLTTIELKKLNQFVKL